MTSPSKNNFSLKAYNTFGIEAYVAHFSIFSSVVEAIAVCKAHIAPLLILGGGSNILLTKNITGTVALNNITGINITEESQHNLIVKVGAGYNWHKFVGYCMQQGYYGLENLALIPGTVGAAPIQNIGAYGVEVSNLIYKVEFINQTTNNLEVLYNGDCKFAYRDSIFKTELKNKTIITHVYFMLSKKQTINKSYESLNNYFEAHNIKNPQPLQVFDAVIAIRNSKLPNPAELGNAGSFFKNPEISMEAFNVLKYKFNNVVAFNTKKNTMKLAAGWLIEQCGFKGYRNGDAGCYQKQALVLVNYGSATGQEIYNLSEKIINAVTDKFNVLLEREVNIL